MPDFRHAFSNCTQFRACGRFWLSSVQRLRKEEEESVVKHKSADMYVGRPNKSKLPVVIAGFDVPLDTSQLISETSIHLNSAISASSTVTKCGSSRGRFSKSGGPGLCSRTTTVLMNSFKEVWMSRKNVRRNLSGAYVPHFPIDSAVTV